jgi:hypothetical protein
VRYTRESLDEGVRLFVHYNKYTQAAYFSKLIKMLYKRIMATLLAGRLTKMIQWVRCCRQGTFGLRDLVAVMERYETYDKYLKISRPTMIANKKCKERVWRPNERVG